VRSSPAVRHGGLDGCHSHGPTALSVAPKFSPRNGYPYSSQANLALLYRPSVSHLRQQSTLRCTLEAVINPQRQGPSYLWAHCTRAGCRDNSNISEDDRRTHSDSIHCDTAAQLTTLKKISVPQPHCGPAGTQRGFSCNLEPRLDSLPTLPMPHPACQVRKGVVRPVKL